MSESIGAAVVGTGFGLFTHVRALRNAGFEVRAIIGRDKARTVKRAAPLSIPLATSSLDDVLADPGIRLVTVATPPHAHYGPVMQAIKAGRHVVCEKPFAKNLTEARDMFRAAEAAGVTHMLGAEFRFDSAQALLRRIVVDGAIGEPLHFLRLFHVPGLQDPRDTLSPWWEDASQGGGFLGAFGWHMIDQVHYMMGQIKAVSAQLQTLAPSRPTMSADDCYSLQFETAIGAKGTLLATIAAPGPALVSTKVVGTKGAAWIQSDAGLGQAEEVWIQNKDGMRKLEIPTDLVNPPAEPFPIPELIQTEQDKWHTQGFDVPPYTRLFAEMKTRIDGAEPRIPERAANFGDALQVQAVLDAARLSAAKRQWIELESV